MPWPTIIGLALATGAFFAFVIAKALLAQRRRPTHRNRGMIGEIAEVRQALEPDGMVFVEGELWRGRSESGALAVGERVVVTGHDGMLLHVRRTEQATGERFMSDDSVVATQVIRPYPPSWLDRLTVWVERLPVPASVVYAFAGLLAVAAVCLE